MEDVNVKIEPDSRAEGNVMDEHQFTALTNHTRESITLAPSRTKLNTLQGELPEEGEFTATIRNKTCGTKICCSQRKNQLPTTHQQRYLPRAQDVANQRGLIIC